MSGAPPVAHHGSMLRRLALNTSIYTIGNLLVMAAGFLSFPVLTRLLPVDEYGLMELTGVTLLFLVGVGKLGFQQSVLRFYARVTSRRIEFTLPQYYSTSLFGMAATGLALSLAWLAFGPLTPDAWWKDARVHELFQLTSVLILVRVVESALVNIVRAQQRAAMHAGFNVAKRWTVVLLTVGSVLLVERSVRAFYYGMIAAETLCVVALGVLVHRFARFSPRDVSGALFRRMFAFGLPLVGSELGASLLNLGDRYILQILLGPQQVGEYSAAYNLCEYAEIILIYSVGTAIAPIYTKLYDEAGREATEAFLSRSLQYYLLVGLPLMVGMTAVGPGALTFLASAKYAPGAVVIPWVVAGTFVNGLQAITVAGLYVGNRTRMIVAIVIGSAVLNVAINFALVPRMGIEGAGVATLVSYVAMTGAMLLFSREILRVRFPWAAALRYGLASAAMYVLVKAVDLGAPTATLFAQVSAGAAFYFAVVIAIDENSRDIARRALRRARRGLAPTA